jgi:ATP-binding cassette, subfamily C (CFTR/MRP), member 10
MQVSRNLSDWWLTYWVTHVSHNSTSVVVYSSPSMLLDQEYTLKAFKLEEATFYLSIYGMIAGLNSVFTLFRAFLFAYGGVRAAASLHSKLLKSVLRVRLSVENS